MYLLDTCTVSDYVKVYSEALNKKLMSYSPELIFLSALTIDEIEFGLTQNESARKKLGPRIQLFLETLPQENILNLDYTTAKISGKLRAQLQKQGKPEIDADKQGIRQLRKIYEKEKANIEKQIEAAHETP